ncbi:electron transport complex subunit RsxG [Methylocaldum sp.]|uniref:electron transport complex subunit RsxG n=1 Tax=Methylocaldum sp. TaxID=1969727 RepID=UPI002D32AD13|nr:electron transport complex subunit RsxG [Methylocaldum sp.]HYE37557.1 electron transport complex subunit RsxG [Methylocaldum sp.]
MITLNRETLLEFADGQWKKLRRQFDDLDALRKRLDYQTYLLAACALAASLLLGIGDLITKGAIERRQAEDLQATLGQVLPEGLYDNDVLANPRLVPSGGEETGFERTEVYVARKNGEVTAVAFKMLALGGYSGPLSLILGLDRDGKILGVRVIAHTETPGLGDKVETSKSDWILKFTGRSLSNTSPQGWRVKKDGGEFDQFAGATITPRAVVKGIAGGLKFFERHRQELLAATD